MEPLAQLYRAMSARRRKHLGVTLAVMLLGAAAEMVTIGAALPFLALIADPQSRLVSAELRAWLAVANGDPIAGAAILLIAAALFATAVRLLLFWLCQSLILRFGQEVSTAIFSRTIRQSYLDHVSRNSSEMLAGMEKARRAVVQVLQPAMQAFVALVLATAVAALLFLINAIAAGIAGVSVVLAYLVISFVTRGRLRRNSRLIASAISARIKIVQEALGGFRDIQLDRSHALFETQFATLEAQHRRAQAESAMIATAPRFVFEGVGIVALAAAALAVSSRADVMSEAVPVLGALALGAQRLLPLLQQAYSGWSQFAGNHRTLEDVVRLLQLPVADAGLARPPAGPPFAEEVVFDRVSFRYPSGVFAIQDLSLQIGRGERIGIRGSTGGGKSTFLDLLMGLLEPSDGSIRVDGKTLGEDLRAAWQSQIGHVPQSVYLSDQSIAANIAFAQSPGGIDMARVREAARAAHLEAFVATLPDGYETLVGERGVRLSGGQRQRIGLARALYRRASILILDEATNALDGPTEAAVLESIMSLGDGITVAIVAHRPSALACCDRIVTIEAGRLVDVDGGP